jgi:hypothetical protein
VGSGRARLLLSTHSCDAHPGTVRSTTAWRWIESSQQLEPGGSPPSRHELLIHERTLGLSALNQRLQTHFNASASIPQRRRSTHTELTAVASVRRITALPDCRILNRPPGQLVALVHALHRSGLPNGGEENDLWTKVATFLSSAVEHIVKECTVAATSVLDLGPLAVPA